MVGEDGVARLRFATPRLHPNRGVVPVGTKPDGGRPKDRYLLFHIPIKLEKKVHFVDNGRFRKGYEKVVVRERNMSAGERRYWDAEVLAR